MESTSQQRPVSSLKMSRSSDKTVRRSHKTTSNVISPTIVKRMINSKKRYDEECRLIEARTEIMNFETRKELGPDAPLIIPHFPPRPNVDSDIIRANETPRTRKASYEYSPDIRPRTSKESMLSDALKHGCPCCNPTVYNKPRPQSRLIHTAPRRNRKSKTWSIYGSGPFHERGYSVKTKSFDSESIREINSPLPELTPEEKHDQLIRNEEELLSTLHYPSSRPLSRLEKQSIDDMNLFETRQKTRQKQQEARLKREIPQ